MAIITFNVEEFTPYGKVVNMFCDWYIKHHLKKMSNNISGTANALDMGRATIYRWLKDNKTNEPVNNNLKGKCSICGLTENLIAHHIVPKYKGGENNSKNISILCERCHKLAHQHIIK